MKNNEIKLENGWYIKKSELKLYEKFKKEAVKELEKYMILGGFNKNNDLRNKYVMGIGPYETVTERNN